MGVMPIPCPHFKITIVKRSQGQSAVAGAAYQSSERLFSEYDQKTKFYNKKKELVHAEIMLPSHAPPGFADRATLWNAVEAVENQWNSQLARRIVLAFPVEVPKERYLSIFDLAILGLGTRDIAMMLNDESVPVPSVYNKENKAYGKETTYTIAPVILWDSSRVWKILTAYVYTGAMVLGKTKTLISGKSIIRTVPKGQRYITEGTHEAIVSREEFEKAQLVIKSNSHKVLMGGVDFPLKGKVRCGNCRRVMAHNFKQVVPTFWCREGLELVGQTQCTSEIFQVSDIESAVFQALKRELSLLDSLYGDIQKEEQDLKEAHKKANRRKTLMEQELKNLKGEKMRMYEEYAAGTLPLDTYKQKKQECDRRISEVQEQIEQSKAEESVQSVVPGTMRAAAEQAENFLNGTRLTAGMVSAFIENVFVYGDGRIVVRFKYEQSIQDAARALHKS
ncbi:MAG: MobA/MobL family protein [Faecalibacterium prausnitzii]|nr:MobA/MobL family protein [Faecalibacterium prausnitzii]